MKTSIFCRALFVVLLSASFSITTGAQSVNGTVTVPSVITVTGNALVEAAPDQAVLRIGIVRQAGTAKDAQDETNKIGQAILKAIASLGVTAQRIKTSQLTISPMYAPQRPGASEMPRLTGYMASNTVTVTIDNLALIGPLVDAGLDNGANQLEGVQFRLKNEGPAREQALKLAVGEAKGKAAAMAEALLVTLGPVLEVSETGVSVVPLEERAEGTIGLLSAARSQVATPVSPGQIEINAGVVLRYAIVSKY